MIPAAEVLSAPARRAEALRGDGRAEEARSLLLESLDRDPGSLGALLALAELCREAGLREEARGRYESALAIDPDCPRARLRLAELLNGDAALAHSGWLAAQEPWDNGFRLPIPEARSARTAFPRDPAPAVPVRSVAEEEDGEEFPDEEAIPHVATVTLAEIYFQQGLKEQAAQIYRQLLERQPGDASVKRRLEEIESSNSEPAVRATGGNG